METAFFIIGKVISITKAIWKIIEDVKELEKSRSDLQSQLNILLRILDSLERSDSLQNPMVYGEVHAALKNLDSILEDAFEKCAKFNLQKAIDVLESFQGNDKTFLKRLIDKIKQAGQVADIALRASSDSKVLEELDKQLILALNILQVAFSYTHFKNLQQLSADVRDVTVTDSSSAVYTNPTGDTPKAVDQKLIKVEVKKQCLVVSWKNTTKAKKYEVSYHETKRLTVTSTALSVAIGPERIKPWQDYAIQVRAINNAGASAWSFPPVYVRLNEGPPSRPSLLNIEAIDHKSLKVIAQKPPREQEVEHVYIEKKITSETAWDGEEMKVNKQGEYILRSIHPEKEYMVRIYYKNKFDFSEPSRAIPVKINDMLPSAPTKVKITSHSTETSITFNQKNFGAVSTYQVYTSNCTWKEIKASAIESRDDCVSFSFNEPISPFRVRMKCCVLTTHSS